MLFYKLTERFPTTFIAYVPQLVSPVITFAIFIGSARNGATNLDPARIFTSLSLLFLVSDPLFNFFAGLIQFMTALGCLKRVEEFLLSPSRVDARTTRENVSSHGPKSKGSSEACISVQNGTFGWKSDSAFVLHNFHINLQPGDIIFVMGPVGCGKSTLIKALLGETPVSRGSVVLSRRDISLCEQSPWIMVGLRRRCDSLAPIMADLSFTEPNHPCQHHLLSSV